MTAALCAFALAACGSSPETIQPIKGAKPRHQDARTVQIYSSLPLHGPLRAESEAIIKGIRLATYQQRGRVHEFAIKYTSLDDATAAAKGWTARLAEQNAQTAATNPQAVFYIGDLDTSATKLSLPILNQAGIVQVTPGSAYAGLTDNVPHVTRPGEPLIYYPVRNSRTLLRMVPSDVVEAAAGLDALKTYGGDCAHVAGVAFGPAGDAYPLIKAFRAQAGGYGLTFLPSASPGSTSASFFKYAQLIKEKGAGCVVLTGHVTAAAVALTRVIHEVLPTAMILGTSGFCNPAWTRQQAHAAPSNIDTFLYCTSPVLPVANYPGYKQFRSAYRSHYRRGPALTAYTLFGYQAAEMAEEAIEELGAGEDDRTVIRRELLGGDAFDSVLGPIAFNRNGDTTSRTFGLYRPGSNGSPKFFKAVKPPIDP